MLDPPTQASLPEASVRVFPTLGLGVVEIGGALVVIVGLIGSGKVGNGELEVITKRNNNEEMKMRFKIRIFEIMSKHSTRLFLTNSNMITKED